MWASRRNSSAATSVITASNTRIVVTTIVNHRSRSKYAIGAKARKEVRQETQGNHQQQQGKESNRMIIIVKKVLQKTEAKTIPHLLGLQLEDSLKV
ncbi:OLC1v1038632C1 [Oldenlandia corymbosa var. corymbosa]|uniref:OLC1v1038632C1 n=1 Tax=Oldenlandia corymbosa var. corymbosa TaxID=529605 RepID=A0AAV1D2Y5_OLDCO|nr:OLC1v1038632C1 [Oldenlandia corymbosa var. corymbosa]